MIEVTQLTKTYGKKHNIFTALDDVSFTIPDGASVAILGKSGSGKSTLMHAMSGLDRPQTGKVVIDGEDILTLKTKAVDKFRATKMSFIFQSFFIQANENCYDNVTDALESVELGDKIKSKAKNLSGGQKQRLAIARAIVNKPQIIFADEPTGNLDSATGEKVEDILFGYNKKNGVTLIIVTHDPDLARKCDMQINVKDGKIESIRESKTKSIANVTKKGVSTV